MNPYLLTVLVVALLVLGWFTWRYYHLRRNLRSFSELLRHTTQEKLSAESLPRDVSGLEDLSNAVRALSASLEARSLDVDAERARLSAVLERMTDGVLIADAGGYVTYLNPAAGQLFNAPAALGKTVTEIVRHHQLVEAWHLSLKTGQKQEESIEIPGSRQFLQLVILPDKETRSSLLLVQNLTRVRRMEKVRRDFISNVSHELRTPLASLKALTETLRDGALNDPVAAPRFLERIEIEVDALTQMAQELLDLARIESGQVPIEMNRVDATRLLASVADRMTAQIERAGLTLTAENPADLPDIRANAPRLEQVLVNLVHNAIKFTAPDGRVLLSASVENSFMRFTVEDNGVGIPEDELERVFERFYKADRARSGGGTGLGLSIARHIVEAHRGRIWVESLEGQGSKFNFTIPIF
jgi:two-component system phosphate regulon sensor histidine kinase PhoR